MRIIEARKSLTDDRLKNLVIECVDTLKRKGFDVTMSDLALETSDSTTTLGSMKPPEYPLAPYTLTLSKYLSNDTDENIKNTIYHELCHYLQFKELVKRGIADMSPLKGLVWSNKYNLTRAQKNDYIGHGDLWKSIAKDVGAAVGMEFSRLAAAEEAPGFYKAVDDAAKYIIRCRNCGNRLTFMRKTDFVKDPNINQYDYMVRIEKIPEAWIEGRASKEAIEKYKSTYEWRCGQCGKGGDWEIIKNG